MTKRKQAIREQMGTKIKPVKVKRKRKPMTPEQKAAAVERLAKARAARGPAKNSSIAESIRNIPDESPFSVKTIKAIIKEQKDHLSAIRSYKNSTDKNEKSRYYRVEAYVNNLEAYLRDGVYRDMFYGANGTTPVQFKSVAMAYYKDGTPKRSVGVFYPDIGEVYTQEMEDNDRRVRVSK